MHLKYYALVELKVSSIANVWTMAICSVMERGQIPKTAAVT